MKERVSFFITKSDNERYIVQKNVTDPVDCLTRVDTTVVLDNLSDIGIALAEEYEGDAHAYPQQLKLSI
jgi:hypothetical protein